MAVNIQDPQSIFGMMVTGRGGEKLGKVEGVYLDNDTRRPEWAAVKSGLFGSHVSLVPLATADVAGDELRVPFDKDALQSAPHHDPDKELSTQDEKQLFEHYGVGYGGESVTAQSGQTAQSSQRGVGQDVSGPNTNDAMTRSTRRPCWPGYATSPARPAPGSAPGSSTRFERRGAARSFSEVVLSEVLIG